jgi:hypothetical protein
MYIDLSLLKTFAKEYFLTAFSILMASFLGASFAYATSFLLDAEQGKWIALWSMSFGLIGFVLKEGSNE